LKNRLHRIILEIEFVKNQNEKTNKNMLKQILAKPVLFGRSQIILWSVFVLVFVSFAGVLPKTSDRVNAATSSTVNFQARLLQANGAVVADGYYNVDFKIYNHPSNGAQAQGTCSANCLWEETYYDSNGVTAGNDNRVQVVNGYLTVSLGSQTAFTAINWDQELWLTMNIGDTTQTATPSWDGEMSPRLKFTASPYAFAAGKLQTSSGADTSTLGFASQTASRSLLLPDEAGTLCIQTSINCGFAATTGAAGYIQNTTSQQASSNFNISGNGVVGTAMSVGTGVAPANGLLTIGTNLTSSSAGGLYFGTDTNLYRNTTAELKTDGAFLATGRVVANSGGTTDRAALGIDLDGTTPLAGISLGGTTTFDTKIYRQASGIIATNGSFGLGSADNTASAIGIYLENVGTTASLNVTGSTAGSGSDTVLRVSMVGDTNSRFSVRASGELRWGAGNTAQDITLRKTGVGELSVVAFGVPTLFAVSGTASQSTTDLMQFRNSGGTILTAFQSDGKLVFGPLGAQDTNLYRSTSNTLKTDDSFAVNTKFTVDVANDKVLVGVSGGDTTGTVLVLGVRTTTGDPTGTDGGMYYNNALGAYRCHTAGAWQACGAQTKKVSSDIATTSTSYADVTGLTFPVVANTDYVISCTLSYQSSATTPGLAFSVNGPASQTMMSSVLNAFTGASANTNTGYTYRAYDTGTGISGVPVVSATYTAKMDTVFRNGANAGTFAIRYKSLSASVTATVKAGSTCSISVI
jgi:hypothetical protein